MGVKGFEYENSYQIIEEINRLTPSYGGITYELEKGGIYLSIYGTPAPIFREVQPR
jgi:predicted molibdopterin-dependent oxidoreductase YjgC